VVQVGQQPGSIGAVGGQAAQHAQHIAGRAQRILGYPAERLHQHDRARPAGGPGRLRQLEAEGLVQIAPRRGAFVVSPPTEDEVREVYRLREVLEAYATTEAVCALTAEDIDEMDALLVQMAQVGRSTTDEQWSRLNRTWHFRLYSGAQSPLLLQFINTLWDRCRLTSNVQARDLGHRDRPDEDHTRIMAAVRARDARLAAGIIADHVRNAMDEILDQNLAEEPAEPSASSE